MKIKDKELKITINGEEQDVMNFLYEDFLKAGEYIYKENGKWYIHKLKYVYFEKQIEEEKKFTKEDFIKERMDLEGITREHFDKRYKVEECNCGMPYCKGFRAIEREEKKIPEKLDHLIGYDIQQFDDLKEYVEITTNDLFGKVNKVIDTLDNLIDYLKSKGE